MLSEIKDYLRYENESGKFFWIKKTYRLRIAGAEAGHKNRMGYVYIRFKNKTYLAHRLAWYFVYGFYPTSILDHINGNGLDNRIANLRESDHRKNQKNRRSHREGRLPGTSYRKRHDRWDSRIFLNGKSIHIGSYNTEKEAHEKYLFYESELRKHGFITEPRSAVRLRVRKEIKELGITPKEMFEKLYQRSKQELQKACGL